MLYKIREHITTTLRNYAEDHYIVYCIIRRSENPSAEEMWFYHTAAGVLNHIAEDIRAYLTDIIQTKSYKGMTDYAILQYLSGQFLLLIEHSTFKINAESFEDCAVFDLYMTNLSAMHQVIGIASSFVQDYIYSLLRHEMVPYFNEIYG